MTGLLSSWAEGGMWSEKRRVPLRALQAVPRTHLPSQSELLPKAEAAPRRPWGCGGAPYRRGFREAEGELPCRGRHQASAAPAAPSPVPQVPAEGQPVTTPPASVMPRFGARVRSLGAPSASIRPKQWRPQAPVGKANKSKLLREIPVPLPV